MWRWLNTPETITQSRLWWLVIIGVMLDDVVRKTIQLVGG